MTLPQPQESYLWEEFGNIIRNMRDKGAKADRRWMELACATQKVLLALDVSMQKGHCCVKVADMTPVPHT